MTSQKKSWLVVFLRNWREPIIGTVLSVSLVAFDILLDHFELPRSKLRFFLLQAIQEDMLKTAILILGPGIGFVLRHFRIKREELFQDLSNLLIHIVDHEIRNPLMVIMSASSLMKQSDAEDAKRLRQVSQGVDRIVEAVSNLGSMSNMTTTRFYNIRDYLKSSTSPARDLKRWASHTAVIEPQDREDK